MKSRIPMPVELAHRPFSIRVGASAGVGYGRLRGADLQRPFAGVRNPSPYPLDLESLARTYQTRMPQHAFFCRTTAASLWGVPLPRTLQRALPLHVAVPAPHRCPRGRGVMGHTFNASDAEVRWLRGLPVTTPERTWFDLGAVLTLPDLVAATDFLIGRRSPLTTKRNLAGALAGYAGRRGRVALREALELADGWSESRKESQLRLICVNAQFSGLVANLEITTSGGFHYRGDLAFPKERVLLEYQSDYHGDIVQFRKDMTRRSRLEADGWFVMLINADDLHNPEELVARIRKVLFDRAKSLHLR
ncbi:MAG TPA: hypothetical protein VN045_09605 [Microbacteriaceae bacterium]|nr:hypothetical protein [Microbacteriaceae bacterium]